MKNIAKWIKMIIHHKRWQRNGKNQEISFGARLGYGWVQVKLVLGDCNVPSKNKRSASTKYDRNYP